ncbi:hypothetical protein ACFO1B_39585 [Dactylosporangium siamense]|uniref:Uncharacterized protein n=1 Tax=Dactylosporangium siamense TaxID=685454 RepID=A0A919PWY1_9ACTN|nr:hypothetical protein [Dactylosporangium siamense]GIG49895.1 hypothetical protein Dsi01nite_079360 [Dactylosporangium siamense]
MRPNQISIWFKPDFLGYRGKLQDCYGQSLATFKWSRRVASAYYNINYGAVQFLEGSYPLFQVGVSNRSLSNAGGNSYRATHVYRYC